MNHTSKPPSDSSTANRRQVNETGNAGLGYS